MHAYKSITFALVASGITLPCLAQQQTTRTPIPAEVRFVVAGVQDGREKFRCAQATITHNSSTPKQFFEKLRSQLLRSTFSQGTDLTPEALKQLPTTDVELTRIGQFHLKNGMLLLTAREDPRDQDLLRFQRVAVDKTQAYVLHEYDKQGGKAKPNDESGIYRFGFVLPRVDALKNGVFNQLSTFDPRAYAYFDYPGGRPLDELLLDPKRIVTYKGEELLEGSRCMKIEIMWDLTYKVTIWVDMEHDFILRRKEDHILSNGKMLLSRESHVPRVQESNGVWLPSVVENRKYLMPVASEPGKSPQTAPSNVSLVRTTISNFNANCDTVPDEVFVMKWPRGTNVRNQITQKGFVADGSQINEGEEPQQGKADAKKTN